MTTLSHVRLDTGRVFFDGEELTFPGLEIGDSLGEGANALVVGAREIELDPEVALKVWDHSVSPTRFDRALSETKKLAAIAHPLFVTVHRFDRVGTIPYAVLERVQGQTAEQWRQEHDLTLHDRLAFWSLYARALRVLHNTGSIHGDPHTKNVLVFDDHEGIYQEMHGVRAASRFGLKLSDMGTSLLWKFPGRLRLREAQVILETGTRLWEPEDPSAILDLEACDDIRLAILAFDSYAKYRVSMDSLDHELQLQRDDDYALRYHTQNIASSMAMFPLYHVQRVLHHLGGRVPPAVLQNMINVANADAGEYQRHRSLAGGMWGVSVEPVTEGEFLESFRRWRETYLNLELFA